MQQDRTRVTQRRALIAARNALLPDQRAALSEVICQQLRAAMNAALGSLNNLSVGAYYPLGSEPSIVSLFSEFRQVALPSVTGPDTGLTFVRYRPGDVLVLDGFGVQVPEKREVIAPAILLIPCVGFKRRQDQRIDRLGYGGGFYDRTLAAAPRLTIGIAFEQAEVDDFEAHEHDLPLDALVTEKGLSGRISRRHL